ncbi:zinc finger BED domain-containing protein RICESLEEPER 4-like [Henckelia pumila]|uniref:zinc finger BED domain-containing protein RICESLEEPER 4-like n=1 Tax=Henckelia pumila TaxID=405737 RepID=UPI003C6E24A8
MDEDDRKLGESKNSNDESQITSSTKSVDASKKRKSINLRSTVWEHFERYEDCDGNKRARCRYCSSNYAADSNSSGTSSLGNHMRKCTQNPHNAETKQAKLEFKPNSNDVSESSLNVWRFDQESCRKALARMIIVDEQPFSLVEREGFKHFINILQPLFRIPSRASITRDCFELFLEEKKN